MTIGKLLISFICTFQVTPFANQFERQAILDAAELAGLNVLTLMHDETAGKCRELYSNLGGTYSLLDSCPQLCCQP